MTAELSKAIANFTLPATDDQTISLSQFKGQHVVLYFYPKDSTPGCTTESKDFRDHIQAFTEANTVILGVSRDSLKSHEKFKEKHGFPFALLSDADEELCNYFQVLKDKSMFGKKFKGIERSTFLIDKAGILRQEWRKVKVSGHVEEVLAAVRALA